MAFSTNKDAYGGPLHQRVHTLGSPKWVHDFGVHLRFKGASASCSALEKSSSRCFTWPQTHLVVLFNADAPPTPSLQRFAEHSKDSCQLVPDCDILDKPSHRIRRPAGPVFAIVFA